MTSPPKDDEMIVPRSVDRSTQPVEGSSKKRKRKSEKSESRLKITDLTIGTGKKAKSKRLLTVHYSARLRETRKKFETTKGEDPFTFRLGSGHVIKGWDEGLIGMRVGGRRKLKIPPELGYGDEGLGDLIPPKAWVTFKVELMEVTR